MQCRTSFCGIDYVTCKKSPARTGNVYLMGQLQQVLPDGLVEEIA
jgi:hypothetical protein